NATRYGWRGKRSSCDARDYCRCKGYSSSRPGEGHDEKTHDAGCRNDELAGNRAGADRALASAILLLRPEPGRRSGDDEREDLLRSPAVRARAAFWIPAWDWKDCSLYGAATYTCDSSEMDTAEEAEKARAAILDQVKACLGAGWAEAAERSSPNYVVLHDAVRPVAITLSTDQTDSKKHVVRLIVFVRRN